MTKKIAVINDLSGFGRCSLTAAISVISAMGVQPCPLPTAILSAQTGYPSYFCDDYTDKMDAFRLEWEKMGVSFDGIYTGFLSDSRQVQKIFDFLDTFYESKTFLLTDPVMGDNGKRFDFCTPDFLSMMRELACRADIITPNLTELCLLAGEDHRMPEQISDEKEIFSAAEQMAREIIAGGTKEVVVTGIKFFDKEENREKIGNLFVSKDDIEVSTFPFVGESYSGTGDLFASAIAGGKARDARIEDIMDLAGEMIGRAIEDAVRWKVPRNEGANYEKYLWMLTQINNQIY